MASNKNTSLALFLTINLVFFTLSSACGTCPSPKPMPKPKPTPTPKIPTPTTPTPTPTTPTPTTPTPTPTTPTPTPTTPTPSKATCPRDTLRLGVCGDLLGGLLGLTVGTPSNTQCCSLIQGLADVDAAVCLCTAIRANVLGINLNVPVSLSVLLNACSKRVPQGFVCA